MEYMVEGWMNGDGWVNGWMNKWVIGWKDKWMATSHNNTATSHNNTAVCLYTYRVQTQHGHNQTWTLCPHLESWVIYGFVLILRPGMKREHIISIVSKKYRNDFIISAIIFIEKGLSGGKYI